MRRLRKSADAVAAIGKVGRIKFIVGDVHAFEGESVGLRREAARTFPFARRKIGNEPRLRSDDLNIAADAYLIGENKFHVIGKTHPEIAGKIHRVASDLYDIAVRTGNGHNLPSARS